MPPGVEGQLNARGGENPLDSSGFGSDPSIDSFWERKGMSYFWINWRFLRSHGRGSLDDQPSCGRSAHALGVRQPRDPSPRPDFTEEGTSPYKKAGPCAHKKQAQPETPGSLAGLGVT